MIFHCRKNLHKIFVLERTASFHVWDMDMHLLFLVGQRKWFNYGHYVTVILCLSLLFWQYLFLASLCAVSRHWTYHIKLLAAFGADTIIMLHHLRWMHKGLKQTREHDPSSIFMTPSRTSAGVLVKQMQECITIKWQQYWNVTNYLRWGTVYEKRSKLRVER